MSQRLDIATLELQPSPSNLRVLIEYVVEVVRMHIQIKALDFDRFLPDWLPEEIELDEIRFRQVLLNLLSNAVKFKHRGKITLRVTRLEAIAPESRSLRNTETSAKHIHLRFVITDTGIGIPPEKSNSIF